MKIFIIIIKHFLSHMNYEDKKEKIIKYDTDIVCDFN